MHKELQYTIKSIAPIMLHNGQLADPLNPYTKRLKEVTSKKKKTDADHHEIADIEWEGGLYLDENRRVIIPGENIEAALILGGKKQKCGPACKAGIISDGNWLLQYDGPKDLEKLKADRRFRDTRGARNPGSGARIMRTRPIFPVWSLTFTVHYLPDLLNESQITEFLTTVGRIIGLGDFKPKYGRFVIA